jgi:hypothetical protein
MEDLGGIKKFLVYVRIALGKNFIPPLGIASFDLWGTEGQAKKVCVLSLVPSVARSWIRRNGVAWSHRGKGWLVSASEGEIFALQDGEE